MRFGPQDRPSNRAYCQIYQVVKHPWQGPPSREENIRSEGGSRESWGRHFAPIRLLSYGSSYGYHKRIFHISQANCVRRKPSNIARPVVAPQEIGAELIEARAADLAHHQVDLVDEDVDRLFHAGKPAGGGTIER